MDGQAEGRVTNTGCSRSDKGRQIVEQGIGGREIGRLMTETDQWMEAANTTEGVEYAWEDSGYEG